MRVPGLRRTLVAFGPAAALVGRLRYARKFIVVGLVLLVPLGLVAYAYVNLQRSQIAFSVKERSGVALMAPLLRLTGDVVAARHTAVSGTGPPARVLAAVAAVDAAAGPVAPTLRVGAGWRDTRALVLAADRATGSPARRYPAYNAAADALLALIVRVGDESNLTLDPDLDTYYLMDILQFRLPVLLDQAGRSTDGAVLAAARTGADPQVFIDLGLHRGVLSSARESIDRAAGTIARSTADPQVRRDVTDRLARLDAALGPLDDRLAAAVTARRPGAVPATAADAVRVAATDFAAASAATLDRLLRVRIAGFAGRAHRVELGTGAAGLLAIYLFVGFYLSVATPIRRIVEALFVVAGGDLTRRVQVDTRDELSFLADALNCTIEQTEIVANQLSRQATHDPLTELPNRSLVLDRLRQAMSRARRIGRPMAVLFIDLDRFKIINDSRGHDVGDEVLRAVSGRLTALARSGDTVARLAGDEFVMIAEELPGPDTAVRLAERVVAALSEPIRVRSGATDRDVGVGASVGIAIADGTGTAEPEALLRDADVAMYRAKQRGRGRVEIFDDALRIAVERRLELQEDLRRGIEAGQLRVFYQPIVDAAAGRVVGFEALARWQHPSRGLLGAADFVEIAEETGLIVPLGAAVLAQACGQAAAWRADRPGCEQLHIAVNVSAPQFSHPSFVPTVARVLATTGLSPDALWLEITETSIMADAEAIGSTLDALRALGVHLAIDDFGTGYSSLAYLRRFPVEILKVDRSFVAGLGHDREDEAIIAMIVSLARTLDLLIVAEGVETAGQLDLLRRLGCDTVQGYYLGRPVRPEAAFDFADPSGTAVAVLALPPDTGAPLAVLPGRSG